VAKNRKPPPPYQGGKKNGWGATTQYLRDLRQVYAQTAEMDMTQAQKNLRVILQESPLKFHDLLQRAEAAHKDYCLKKWQVIQEKRERKAKEEAEKATHEEMPSRPLELVQRLLRDYAESYPQMAAERFS
jgi:hypothetical protein